MARKKTNPSLPRRSMSAHIPGCTSPVSPATSNWNQSGGTQTSAYERKFFVLSFSASCDPIFIRTCRGSSGSLRARVVGGTRVAPTGALTTCVAKGDRSLI